MSDVTFSVIDYERKQPMMEMVFRCAICGQVRRVRRLPGAHPKYCPGSGKKLSACQREANRRRAAAWRRAREVSGAPDRPTVGPEPIYVDVAQEA